MSHNLFRVSTTRYCNLTCTSSGAGNVIFSFIEGDFSPTINSTELTLSQGYEYFITISLATSNTGSVFNYNSVLDNVSGTSYSFLPTSNSSGLDELSESITTYDQSKIFKIYTDGIVNNNSRISIWRINL
jgi:hypothetical protein